MKQRKPGDDVYQLWICCYHYESPENRAGGYTWHRMDIHDEARARRMFRQLKKFNYGNQGGRRFCDRVIGNAGFVADVELYRVYKEQLF